MANRDNKMVLDAQEVIRARLPAGWKISIKKGAGDRLQVRGPDGRSALCNIHTKHSLQPRGVLELRMILQDLTAAEPGIVVAPYLSPAVRDRLVESGLGFVDLTGNIRIALTSPGLFIDARGAEVNPVKQSRASRSLRGGKAGRVVRALIDAIEPPGVRELAENIGANPGYVSRIIALLDQQALIERSGHGKIVSVDWPRLLERWTQDAPLSSRGTQTMCLAPRGLTALTAKLENSDLSYAITGTLAVSAFAPVAAAHLAVVYVESSNNALSALELRVTERGANVMLVEPSDDGVFVGSSLRDGLRVVAASQAAADLLTSPGRGPAEAEALIAWMLEHEEVWRG